MNDKGNQYDKPLEVFGYQVEPLDYQEENVVPDTGIQLPSYPVQPGYFDYPQDFQPPPFIGRADEPEYRISEPQPIPDYLQPPRFDNEEVYVGDNQEKNPEDILINPEKHENSPVMTRVESDIPIAVELLPKKKVSTSNVSAPSAELQPPVVETQTTAETPSVSTEAATPRPHIAITEPSTPEPHSVSTETSTTDPDRASTEASTKTSTSESDTKVIILHSSCLI